MSISQNKLHNLDPKIHPPPLMQNNFTGVYGVVHSKKKKNGSLKVLYT